MLFVAVRSANAPVTAAVPTANAPVTAAVPTATSADVLSFRLSL